MSEPASKPVEQSVQRLSTSAARQEDSADRRTVLAADRTVFAAERTYAAWVRTGLAALASGVGAKAALGPVMPQLIVAAAGSLLALFSAFCFAAAVWRQINPGPPPPTPDARGIPRGILLAVNAALVVVSLCALGGILFARTPGAQ